MQNVCLIAEIFGGTMLAVFAILGNESDWSKRSINLLEPGNRGRCEI